MTESNCNCEEGFVDAIDPNTSKVIRVPSGLRVHDCEYIANRNSIIWRAEGIPRRPGLRFCG
jgi:hypothetical protein